MYDDGAVVYQDSSNTQASAAKTESPIRNTGIDPKHKNSLILMKHPVGNLLARSSASRKTSP